jgi:acyl carrier protein
MAPEATGRPSYHPSVLLPPAAASGRLERGAAAFVQSTRLWLDPKDAWMGDLPAGGPAMKKAQIWELATKVFRETLNLGDLVLTPQLTARDVERWDSFNHILLVVAMEQAFGIKFSTGEIDELENVGQFIDLIERRLPG